MSEVPLSLAELMLGLGINASETAREVFDVVDASRSTDVVEPRLYMEAAVIWRNAHIEDISLLGIIAERALEHLPASPNDARESLARDLHADPDGVEAFLETIQPQYLAEVLKQALKEDSETLKRFLQSLVAYSRLE